MNNFRNSLKTESIISLKTSLSNGKNWLFLGKPTTWPDSDNSPPLNQSIEEDMDCKMGIIALYKLKSSDFAYVIERNDWVLGRVYTEYSSSIDLKTKNYYITTESGTDLNVWICIHNGHDSESTFSPNCTLATTADDSASRSLCLLGDEYQWKLIYTVPNFASNPFCTSTYFPILNNYYPNTDENILKLNITGNTEFLWYVPDNADYYINSVATNNDIAHLQTPPNAVINKTLNYYTNWDMILRDSSGIVKHVLKIKNSNFTNEIFTVQACTEFPDNIEGYRYSIVPGLNIKGTGYNFVAYSNMNENTKTIESISILNSGNEYQNLTITVQGIENNYTVTPVFSIRNNLKSSPINTLKCSELMLYKKISATGVNAYDKTNPVVLTIGSSDYESNDIRQFGIIKSEYYDEITDDIYMSNSSLSACTLLYTTRANSTKTGILLDSYICTVDGVGNITAYGIVVSIAEPPSGADTPVIAVLPLFGTFTTVYPNIKKLNINTLVTESLSPSFTITSVIGAQYIKQSGRIQYLENIYPTTLSTDTALNIRVIISL